MFAWVGQKDGGRASGGESSKLENRKRCFFEGLMRVFGVKNAIVEKNL